MVKYLKLPVYIANSKETYILRVQIKEIKYYYRFIQEENDFVQYDPEYTTVIGTDFFEKIINLSERELELKISNLDSNTQFSYSLN